MQRRIHLRNKLSSEIANKYLQRTYKTSVEQYACMNKYEQLAVEEHLRTCGDKRFYMFSFFRILQENKSLRKYKSYEDYFMDKFKPLFNKRT